MSPTEPFDSFSDRFLAAAQSGGNDFILVSQVLFGSGRIFRPVEELAALGRPDGPWVVIDGYHAFMAVPDPFGEPAARTAFYLGGGYKYAMAGEGCAFMHAPAGFGSPAAGHRLVRRVRGSEPAAGARRLRQGRAAFPRRDVRSLGSLSLQRGTAHAGGEWPDHDRISDHVAALQQQFLATPTITPLADAELLNPLDDGPTRDSSRSAARTRSAGTRRSRRKTASPTFAATC